MPATVEEWRPEPEPEPVHMFRILVVGCTAWAAGLVVTLLVPALHQGERWAWPRVCLAGLGLGLLGLALVRKGIGAGPREQDSPPEAPRRHPSDPPAGEPNRPDLDPKSPGAASTE